MARFGVFLTLFAIVIFVSAASDSSSAQISEIPTSINITTTPQPGSGHDYLKLMQETVNPANGSLSLRIAAPEPKQRGNVNLPYYIFGYDSGGVSIPTGRIAFSDVNGFDQGTLNVRWTDSSFLGGTQIPGLVPGGFVANTGLAQTTYQSANLSTVIHGEPPFLQATCSVLTGFVYTDPFGSSHPLNLQWIMQTGSGGGGDEGCSYFHEASFASGGDNQYQANIVGSHDLAGNDAGHTVYITDASGRGTGSPGSPGYVEDTNGNFSASGGQATFSGNQITSIAIPGLPHSYALTYGTTTRTYFPHATLIAVDSATTCFSGIPGSSVTVPVVKTITLPTGGQYVFSYDPTYGLINQITYPTGAWVKYQWSVQTNSESLGLGDITAHCEYMHDWPAITQKIVSFDGCPSSKPFATNRAINCCHHLPFLMTDI